MTGPTVPSFVHPLPWSPCCKGWRGRLLVAILRGGESRMVWSRQRHQVADAVIEARHYLWRAVDQDNHVLDILVQSRRNKHAAKKFFRKLLKGLQYVPRVVITDKLKSYGA